MYTLIKLVKFWTVLYDPSLCLKFPSFPCFPFSPSPSAENSGVSGLTVASAHPISGLIAGSVIVVLFILGFIATIVGINLAVCLYIAGKSKRQSPACPTVTTESRPILLSSIEDEVDKPNIPPVSVETESSEELKSSSTEAANEKEKEAMEEMKEEEQRYQPQEAVLVTPSKEPETEDDVKA